MNFFLTSDLHLDFHRTFSQVHPDGTTSRLCSIANAVLQGVGKSEAPIALFLGDILNRSRNVDPLLANFTRNLFSNILETGKRVIVFRGNHDCRQAFGKVHCLLKPLLPDKVEYISQPTSLSFGGGVVGHFLPYYPNPTFLKTAIEEFKLNYDNINLFFSHFSVEKAMIRDDFSIGQRWESIPLSLLRKFDYSFLGDIHMSQEIQDVIFYPGSPVQLSFGEEGQEKSTWEITVKNAAIHKKKLRSLAPEFKTLKVETDNDLVKIGEEKQKGNYVRVLTSMSISPKIDIENIIVLEQPKEVKFTTSFNYKDIIFEYVQEKDKDLLPILSRHLH